MVLLRQRTQTASISPYGPSVSGKAAGTAGSPIQYDSILTRLVVLLDLLVVGILL